MLIFPLNRNAPKNRDLQKGLTLVEILVALTIAALLVYVSVSNTSSSDRNNLDEAMDTVEKIINFSINESVLRNRITRAHFDLTQKIPKITIEFNSDHEFVLPDIKKYDDKNLRDSEQKAKKKLINKINSKFKAIEDLDSDQLKIPSSVQILGIATSLMPSFITDEETSLYIYPTGERDRALIIFAAFHQITAMMIEPYTGEIKREYTTLTVADKDDLETEYEKAVEKFFADWQK